MTFSLAGTYENRVISRTIKDGADQPVRTLNAILHMNTREGSISSGAVNSPYNLLSGTFRPAIFGKRGNIVQDWIGVGPVPDPDDDEYWNVNNWRARFWGRVEEHPASHAGDITLFSRDFSEGLMIPYTGPEVWIGDEGTLVPLHEAIQRILDAVFGAGVWSLLADESLEWAVPAFLMGEVADVLQLIRDAAQQRGGVVRWWFDEDTQRFQLTLFILQVDKSDPDFTYGPGTTHDIPAHGSDVSNLRNDFRLQFRNSSGQLQEVRRAATAAEIAAYGLRPLLITEGSTSLINTPEEAEAMLDHVVAALSIPATIGARRLPREKLIEINSFIRFEADARVAQEDVDLYVTSWVDHRSVQGESYDQHTTVTLRGAPVGKLGDWLKSFSAGAITVIGGPLGKGTPIYQYETASDQTIGTLWFKIVERGVAVSDVEAQTKLPGDATWSGFDTPTRGPGDASSVKGGTLGNREYEQDVYIVGDGVSQIHARALLETGDYETIALVPITRDPYPRIIFLLRTGSALQVIGDGSNTESLEIEKISGAGSAYSDAIDGRVAAWVVPNGSDQWTVRVTAYNMPMSDRGESGELSTSQDVVIPADGLSAYFPLFEATAPTSGDEVTLQIEASAADSGTRLRVWSRFTLNYPSSNGFPSSWLEITSDLVPDPTGELPPASPELYQYPSTFNFDSPGAGTVVMEFFAEIVEGSTVIAVSPIETVSWTFS